MHPSTRHVLSLVLASALAACGPNAPRVQRCANTSCAKGTRCDLATELCVQDLGPNVHLVPLSGVVTAPVVTLSGSVSDDTQVKLVQVRQAGEWVEVPLVDGRFTAAIDAGWHDFETVSLEARAFDSLDQVGHASLEVTVDDVGPVIEALGAADGGLSGATVVVMGTVHDGSGTVASVTAALPGGAPQPVAVGAGGAFSATLQAPAGLSSAPCVVTLVAADGSGNASSLALPLVVDSVAPTGTIVHPPENHTVRASFVLWGTVQDNVGVAAVRVHAPGGWIDATLTGTDWRASLTLPDGDNVPHTLEVELVDAAGNSTTLTRHLVVDTVPPSIAFDAPAENATLAASPSPMSATASDGPGTVEYVQFRAPGAAVYGAAGTSGSWAGEVDLPLVDHVQQTLEAIATDLAGNSTIASRTVWIDRVPPVLTITSPADGAVLNAGDFTAGDDVVVRFTVRDGDPLVNVTVDGAPAGFGSTAALVPTSPTDNGITKTVTVVATDASGNSSTQQVSFTVDRVAPTVVIQSPAGGALLGGPNVMGGTVTVSAHDGAKDVSKLEIGFDGAPLVPVAGATPGTWTATYSLPVLDNVRKSFVAVARDAAGNVSSDTASVFVDRVAPVVTVTSPARDAKLNGSLFSSPNNDLTVSWVIADGDPDAGTSSFNGSAVAASVRAAPITTNPNDNPTFYAPVIVARDSAGNQTSVTARFSVDRVGPKLINENATDHATNLEPRRLWYTFSEPIVEDVPFTFTTTRGTVRAGSWNAAHTTFSSGLFDPDSVVATTLQPIHDAYGNQDGFGIPDTNWNFRVHMAVAAPSGVLAAGVSSYDIASDSNGVPTVAVKYTNGDVEAWTYSAATGLREPAPVLARTARPNLQVLKAYAGIKLGADGVTPSRMSGVTTFSCVAPLCSTPQVQDRLLFVGGVEVPGLSTSTVTPAGLVLPDARSFVRDGTGDYGTVDNKLYTRGTTQISLGVQALGSVSGPGRWAAFAWGPTGLQFTHVDQLPGTQGGPLNVVTQTVSTSAAPANVSFAVDQASSCLSVATGSSVWEYPAGHTCPSVGCGLMSPVVTNALPNARVAPFSPGRLEPGLLIVGHDANGTIFRKQKATGTCDAPMVDVKLGVTWPAGSDFRPIQLGNQAAIAYIDPSSNLRVFVP